MCPKSSCKGSQCGIPPVPPARAAPGILFGPVTACVMLKPQFPVPIQKSRISQGPEGILLLRASPFPSAHSPWTFYCPSRDILGMNGAGEIPTKTTPSQDAFGRNNLLLHDLILFIFCFFTGSSRSTRRHRSPRRKSELKFSSGLPSARDLHFCSFSCSSTSVCSHESRMAPTADRGDGASWVCL